MALFSGGGKGNSEAKTEQTAYNEQVATTSGIAVGARNTGTVNILSSDPETVKNSLAASAFTSHEAFNFAGHSADLATQVNQSTTKAITDTAELAILGGNNLAGKFLDSVSDQAVQNIGLLQSLGNSQADIAKNSQDAANQALQASFGVARSVAPQDPSFALETTVGTIGKYAAIFAGVITLVIAIFVFGKKRA